MTGVPGLPEPLRRILPAFAGDAVWLVGGAVRDLLLQRETDDYDFAVDGDAQALGRRLANELGADYYDLDPERGAGRMLLTVAPGRRLTLDFAPLRGGSIRADLLARDFTLNAMAIPLHDSDPAALHDPRGGAGDLRARLLRACTPTSVADDPIRAVRAVRLATEFGLRIDSDTAAQVRSAGGRLAEVSAERSRDELFRLLGLRDAGAGVRRLDHLGLLEQLAPELTPLRGLEQPPPHAYDAFEHSLATADRLADLLALLAGPPEEEVAGDLTEAAALAGLGRFRPGLTEIVEFSPSFGRRRRALLLWTALLHDIGKAQSQGRDSDGRIHFFGHETLGARLAVEASRRLRLSEVEVAEVEMGVLHHLRPAWLEADGPATPRSVYRFFRAAESVGVSVVLLSLADLLARYLPPVPPDVWQRRVATAGRLLEGWFEDRERTVSPPPLLRGQDVMRLSGLAPGPGVGRILEALREAQASGEVRDLEQARRFVAGLDPSDYG